MSLEQDVASAVRKMRTLRGSVSKRKLQAPLRKAAKIMQSSIRSEIPEASDPVYRYATSKISKAMRAPKGMGHIVATYLPGNLKRAYKILNLRRTFDVYLGFRRGKGGTTTYGNEQNVDGWYANLINFGTKYIRPRHFFEQGFNSGKGATLKAMELNVTAFIKQQIDKIAK